MMVIKPPYFFLELTLKTETGWFFSEFYSLGVACFLEADCGEDTNFCGGIGESYKRS